jgi:hypothetical protein
MFADTKIGTKLIGIIREKKAFGAEQMNSI